MSGSIYNLIGYIGDALIILAYLLLQLGKLKSDQLTYALFNFFGAFFLLISLCHAPNAPVIAIEIVWMLISVYGMYKYFKR